jgi:hypothetical protein
VADSSSAKVTNKAELLDLVTGGRQKGYEIRATIKSYGVRYQPAVLRLRRWQPFLVITLPKLPFDRG